MAKAAEGYVGPSGIYASSVVAGLADVDAITLSLTELHRTGSSASVAALGILLAVVTNTLVKAGIAAFLGGKALGARVAVSIAVVLGCGAAGFALRALIGTT